MSIEDNMLRWEGIDPAHVHTALDDMNRLLATIQTVVLPAANKVIGDVRAIINDYEAAQRRYK